MESMTCRLISKVRGIFCLLDYGIQAEQYCTVFHAKETGGFCIVNFSEQGDVNDEGCRSFTVEVAAAAEMHADEVQPRRELVMAVMYTPTLKDRATIERFNKYNMEWYVKIKSWEIEKVIDIYYVEDDETIAQSVKEYLEQRECKVTILMTVADARQALRIHIPTIILVDWNMPDGQGSELCRWIRKRWSNLPVIFLTVRGDSQDIVSGFQDGADDYVVKPFELEVLCSRIRALLRRVERINETSLFCDNLLLDKEKMTVFCEQKEIILSQPEYQLLLMLMENKGKTVTRKQLLEQVWDSNGNYVNDNTLTVTMKRLREKLHNPSCLKTIRSFGYRMEESI